jgi:lipid-A-disaccharide synthase
MPEPRPILFTAFEPSGDALAGRLVEALRRREPDRPIYALGGPAMARAGAALIEPTTDEAAMLGGALKQIHTHRRRLQRLRRWLQQHPIAAAVPTDSPAANWHVCKLVRRHQPKARLAHLAAPQLWAWGGWRIRKLRRLTDRVLCLLPFEPAWFQARGVPASFVGHPLFDAQSPPHQAPLSDLEQMVHGGGPRVAVLPGSREAEVRRNWPAMRDALRQLAQPHPELTTAVCASDAARAQQLRQLGVETSANQVLVPERVEEALDWAEVALVVSGTATLHCVARGRPLVTLYRVSRPSWHGIGRWVVRSSALTLPNLLSDSLGRGRVVPELVPHFGDPTPIAQALAPLLKDGAARRDQQKAFDAIYHLYRDCPFAETACEFLRETIHQGTEREAL